MYLLNLACYCILNFFQVYSYHSLQYYYKSVKEIINYVRNPIQFQGGTKIFYIYTTKKKFYIYFVLKKYRLYLPIPILLADTTKIGRYHRYHRYLSIGTSLVKLQQTTRIKSYKYFRQNLNDTKIK